jgi:hypothetical protein
MAASLKARNFSASSGRNSGGNVSRNSAGDNASTAAFRASSDCPSGRRAAAASHQFCRELSMLRSRRLASAHSGTATSKA